MCNDLAIALGAQGLFRREEIAETAQALLDAARLQIAQCSDRVVEEKAHFYTRPVVLRRVGDLPALRGLRVVRDDGTLRRLRHRETAPHTGIDL